MTRTLIGLTLAAALVTAAHATYPTPAVVIPGNGAQYDPNTKILGEIRDELKLLREEVKLMRSGAPIKPGADRKLAQEQVLLRRCAGCHTPGRVDDGKDGGLLLFNDDQSQALRLLGPREQANVADRIKRGDMPPKPRDPLPVKERELFE